MAARTQGCPRRRSGERLNEPKLLDRFQVDPQRQTRAGVEHDRHARSVHLHRDNRSEVGGALDVSAEATFERVRIEADPPAPVVELYHGPLEKALPEDRVQRQVELRSEPRKIGGDSLDVTDLELASRTSGSAEW